jgi:MFS family permease
VLRAVWLPGLGLAISGVGFGAITTFTTLLYLERGWGSAWIALSVLSLGFMAGRTTFGHLPDRLGGAKVALVCVIIESAGLATIWLAPWPPVALAGVALSGLGYSLVYPGLGVEALRRAPAHSRGLAMGTYTAFLDLSLGVSSPALGWVAGRTGLGGVFLAGSIVVLSSAVIAYRLLRVSARPISLEGADTGFHPIA